MRILHIVYSCVPDEFRGGVAKVVFSLANHQALQGHQVMVYATNYNSQNKIAVPLGQPIDAGSFQITYFEALESRWFRSPAMEAAMRKNALNFDVFHSHNTFLALNRYAATVAKEASIGLFYHVHGALDPVVVRKGAWKRLRKRLYIPLIERRNYQAADGLFALSAAEAVQIKGYRIYTPIHIVPNGVDLIYPQENSGKAFLETWQIDQEKTVILFIGRIVPKKGLHILLKALATIRCQHSEVVLVIAGNRSQEITYTEHLDKLVQENNLENMVRWTGFLSETQKEGAYATADIFSHVTESEGMAMSILEAMGAGLPVIVSKECYMGKAVQAEAVVETEFDTNSLTDALNRLLGDAIKRQQIGQAARDYVAQHHSWSQISKKVVTTYQQVL